MDALRMLGFGVGVALANDREATVGGRGHWPKFLRRRFVLMDRRKRIYGCGDQEELLAMDKACARKLASVDGIEMTPEEVGSHRASICQKFRRYAAEMGMPAPSNDAEIIRTMQRAAKNL